VSGVGGRGGGGTRFTHRSDPVAHAGRTVAFELQDRRTD
jgi:hypothetical protein